MSNTPHVKCWHCGKTTRNFSDAYVKFAKNGEWFIKKMWVCEYCYHNLRVSRNKQRAEK